MSKKIDIKMLNRMNLASVELRNQPTYAMYVSNPVIHNEILSKGNDIVKNSLFLNNSLSKDIILEYSNSNNLAIVYGILNNNNSPEEALLNVYKNFPNENTEKLIKNHSNYSETIQEKIDNIKCSKDNLILLEVLDDYVDKDTNTNTHTRR